MLRLTPNKFGLNLWSFMCSRTPRMAPQTQLYSLTLLGLVVLVVVAVSIRRSLGFTILMPRMRPGRIPLAALLLQSMPKLPFGSACWLPGGAGGSLGVRFLSPLFLFLPSAPLPSRSFTPYRRPESPHRLQQGGGETPPRSAPPPPGGALGRGGPAPAFSSLPCASCWGHGGAGGSGPRRPSCLARAGRSVMIPVWSS